MNSITLRDEVCTRLTPLLQLAAGDGRVLGVLVLRIENLRTVRLSRGYAIGDALVAHARNAVATTARKHDWSARIGDQDFVLVVTGLMSTAQMQLAAAKLLRTLTESLEIDGDRIPLQARIGIACAPEHGLEAGALLLAAENALLQGEQRNEQVAFFIAAAATTDQSDWRIEELFDSAFERGEFELWYQPKLRLADARLTGAEGLTRWKSSVLGSISPGRFIPIAERCGQIERLTWSSINTALQQQQDWNDPTLSVAVNVSAVCLKGDDIVTRIRNALGLWGANPEKLTVEVTESAVMQDPTASFRMLQEIRSLGVRISIDDFGTGQSSLSYFKSLPADELKIDRSFIMNIKDDPADRHIVQTIIELAHRLGHEVVAEGIEDAETAQILKDLRCDIAQGYYFAKPMPAAEFRQLAEMQSHDKKTAVASNG